MAAYFSLGHVVIAGSHKSEDGDGLFSPTISSVSANAVMRKRNRTGAIVALVHSNCLRDFDFFFFNLQDAYVVSIDGLDCCDKFWRGTVSFKDAQQEVVIGRVIGFDEINEADI